MQHLGWVEELERVGMSDIFGISMGDGMTSHWFFYDIEKKIKSATNTNN